ncbi:hypothetical protein [Rhizobium mesoamericanum]|uniref:Uncharacterized protein n=1 Tax=Rhizobium mesoamericanum STM3625 TaxID=1211777 RepID=K0PTC8_9HYPH|nr:hypothetical protein [Rhizobium mesoamericanum]CCM77088.1 conserved hypothetical protein [Rhizobium mesoamericanum STM3625]
MSSFTPGPWSVNQNAYGAVFVHGGETLTTSVGTEYKELIAGGNSHNTLTLDNARLIAAAPDLLEALKRQADNMAFVLNHMTMPDSHYERFMEELELVRAAISKAEPARQSATTVPQGGKSDE